jgi:HEAT repeat protein
LGSTQVTGFGYQMNLASCLSEIRNPAALPTLTRFMASTDPEIRRNAIQGVRNIKTPEAIDPLVAGLYDTDEEVRRSAVWGLVELLDNHKRAYDWEPPEHQSLSMQDDIDSLKAWAKQRQAGKLPP